MKFVKVDDYTFRIEFAAPNPSFPLVNLAHVFGYSHDNAPSRLLHEAVPREVQRQGRRAGESRGLRELDALVHCQERAEQNPDKHAWARTSSNG